MNDFEKLVKLLSDRVDDYQKHLDGNKAAGRRVRVALMEAKKQAHQLRQDISAEQKK